MGIAGLSVPQLLRAGSVSDGNGATRAPKSVILLWMAGGPSHIDTWDPKPDRPLQNGGPFGVMWEANSSRAGIRKVLQVSA